MRATEILKHVRRQPFQAFRVFLSDGSKHEVRHPEIILVTRTNVVIANGDNGRDPPTESISCDPVHITRIELIMAPRRRKS